MTFGTILVLFCITVILFIVSLNKTGKNFDSFHDNGFVISNKVMDLRRSIQASAKYVGYAMMTDDEKATEDYIQTAKNESKSMVEGLAHIEQNFRGDKALVNGFKDSMEGIKADRGSLTTPIKEIEQAASEMAIGSLKAKLDYTSRDEYGSLADSMRILMAGISKIVSDVDYILGQMAAGNFVVHAQPEESYIGDYTPILSSIRNINTSLSEALMQSAASSEELSGQAQLLKKLVARFRLNEGAKMVNSSIYETSKIPVSSAGMDFSNISEGR